MVRFSISKKSFSSVIQPFLKKRSPISNFISDFSNGNLHLRRNLRDVSMDDLLSLLRDLSNLSLLRDVDMDELSVPDGKSWALSSGGSFSVSASLKVCRCPRVISSSPKRGLKRMGAS